MPRKARYSNASKKKDSRKTGVSSQRFRKDPAFEGSRRAMAELGLGSRAATLIRQAFRPMMTLMSQRGPHRQLTRVITNLIRKKKSAGAKRIRLNQLEWEGLEKFDFGMESNLTALLTSDYTCTIHRDTSMITVSLSGVAASDAVHTMPEITHVRITAAAAAIDFEKEKINKCFAQTPLVSATKDSTETIHLSLQLLHPVIHPLLVVMGFAIFKEDNLQVYELNNSRYRTISVIAAQPAPPPVYKQKATRPTKPASRASQHTSAQKKTAKKIARPTSKRARR